MSLSTKRRSKTGARQALLDTLKRMGATPYDARHSFLTESYIVGKDLRVTQALATHSDVPTTNRYTLAAVDPRLAEVVGLLNLKAEATLPRGLPRGN